MILEPGRLIVGNAGVLVASVIFVKKGENKSFVIVDAAMNDLDPPDALRRASRHPAGEGAGAATRAHDRAPTWSGRSARAATILRSTATCPKLAAGDLIAVMTAGAYGAVQAGTYNSRLLVPEVLVRGARICGRPAAADL